jgi:hypothetical protein
MLAGAPFFALLSVLGFGGEHPAHIHFAGYDALVCLSVGLIAGWVIGCVSPTLVPSGRWIWVLPAIVSLPDMVREGLASGPVPWLPESWFVAGTNEGLGVYLLTLPACSALGYSIGMRLAGLKFRLGEVKSSGSRVSHSHDHGGLDHTM